MPQRPAVINPVVPSCGPCGSGVFTPSVGAGRCVLVSTSCTGDGGEVLTESPQETVRPVGRWRPAASMRSPPARAGANRVNLWSPMLARPGAWPKSKCGSTSWGSPRCGIGMAGRISPALDTRGWSSKATWERMASSQAAIVANQAASRMCEYPWSYAALAAVFDIRHAIVPPRSF